MSSIGILSWRNYNDLDVTFAGCISCRDSFRSRVHLGGSSIGDEDHSVGNKRSVTSSITEDASVG